MLSICEGILSVRGTSTCRATVASARLAMAPKACSGLKTVSQPRLASAYRPGVQVSSDGGVVLLEARVASRCNIFVDASLGTGAYGINGLCAACALNHAAHEIDRSQATSLQVV